MKLAAAFTVREVWPLAGNARLVGGAFAEILGKLDLSSIKIWALVTCSKPSLKCALLPEELRAFELWKTNSASSGWYNGIGLRMADFEGGEMCLERHMWLICGLFLVQFETFMVIQGEKVTLVGLGFQH